MVPSSLFLISGQANQRYIYEGNEDEGYGWAGQVIGMIDSIPTVQELFDRMMAQAKEGRRRLDTILGAQVRL